jgi:hypothetical protein
LGAFAYSTQLFCIWLVIMLGPPCRYFSPGVPSNFFAMPCQQAA